MNSITTNPGTIPTSIATVDALVEQASGIFEDYNRAGLQKRILFLEKINEELIMSGHSFIAITSEETSLPHKRLEGEMQRTINQVKMFVALLKEGSWVNAVIDTAQPGRVPMPKPDIRQMQIPLGVVGVFGASNFPYAFSVAGGDTIAALAAGCPVVYKAHPGHPRTSRLMAALVQRAANKAGLPEGVFSMIEGDGYDIGISLVQHSLVKAIAFTGSSAGGKALYNAAAQRAEPIPVYAEMGSVNPGFILPGILKEKPSEIAKALAASNTLSMGQFCTNPGIIVSVRSAETSDFLETFSAAATAIDVTNMLTENISTAYKKGIDSVLNKKTVTLLASGSQTPGPGAAIPYAVSVSGESFLADRELYEELFGPFSINVIADDIEQLYTIARSFPGQLTCSVWANEIDCENNPTLFEILENKAGRIMLNNVPTGVEVTHAMVHGGPFPATSDSKFTSVGSSSIYRFTRPVCYQNYLQHLLPDALKNNNPLELIRFVDGSFTREAITGNI